MPNTIDAYWVDFLTGERAAFEQIYRILLPHLYEYGMWRTADETLVKNAIHDVFVKLWKGREKLRSISCPPCSPIRTSVPERETMPCQ